jgi:8-oxo-dGTP diphosphatase
MTYQQKPTDFKPKFKVVGCFFENNGKILLLRRLPSSSQPYRWGVPAGKMNDKETKKQAIMRELQEETGLRIEKDKLKYLEKFYVKQEHLQFIFYLFTTTFEKEPVITINPKEHFEYQWQSPEIALSMDLVEDLDDCLRKYFKNK